MAINVVPCTKTRITFAVVLGPSRKFALSALTKTGRVLDVGA